MEAELHMEESWEESQTLIQIAEENIYVQIIIYSCLASHDKRQEAQQLKGGEKKSPVFMRIKLSEIRLDSSLVLEEEMSRCLNGELFPSQMTHFSAACSFENRARTAERFFLSELSEKWLNPMLLRSPVSFPGPHPPIWLVFVSICCTFIWIHWFIGK